MFGGHKTLNSFWNVNIGDRTSFYSKSDTDNQSFLHQQLSSSLSPALSLFHFLFLSPTLTPCFISSFSLPLSFPTSSFSHLVFRFFCITNNSIVTFFILIVSNDLLWSFSITFCDSLSFSSIFAILSPFFFYFLRFSLTFICASHSHFIIILL